MAVPITSISQALLDLHSIGMGLYPSLCLVNASCDQVRHTEKNMSLGLDENSGLVTECF